ncbi:3-phosphoserine/phosphohydroxythreonine transaminase [Flavobacterium sp. NKUCC04_CG]|uniref:3-phosphoserine/phosphohydroxythreonine transaminase n=1 Tax=Flavobacterium sp. NKUCC04_CG TaxID=2842121 RepID=UPI001C5AA8E9|nr:3-phosphoserine/phosphohydroxythreonine transaminase [Flavobacterium sp. NKUCC04_CG]MBW3519347.1 3-phosphoserine/phosphohydroxythreonine transaminase [Flavobacterium sp. NKUCC04_CG]
MKMHNFSAGPCILPASVYAQAAEAVLNFDNSGLSILEISHRSKAFMSILDEAREKVLRMLGLKEARYSVLFLQGSASMEFLRVPYNLMKSKAGYIDTGTWSSKAIKEAQAFGEVAIVASSKRANYTYIPEVDVVDPDLDYLHFTSNNTIYGTQFTTIPQVSVPLVCDMSSDIFSRQLDFSRFDLIYAGVQKNIGPAGLSLVVVKKEVLGKTARSIPSMMDYQQHIDQGNLYHTANVFGVYTSLLNLRWLNDLGGIPAVEFLNNAKAKLLYEAIDSLDVVEGIAAEAFRSKMNVTFRFKNSELEKAFDAYCERENIVNIKGHRSVGGYRASLYNALPIESVQVLVQVLEQINQKA